MLRQRKGFKGLEYAFMKGAIENQRKHDSLVRNATMARRNVMAKVLADSQERFKAFDRKIREIKSLQH
jgi:hypothetical protein